MANELILIVEDNEKSRKLVRDVLQVKGYKTIETETGDRSHCARTQFNSSLIESWQSKTEQTQAQRTSGPI